MNLKATVIVLLAGLLLAAGCGRSGGPTLAPVSGTVTYNGQPLEQGTIIFHPPKGRPSHGKIENGKITEVTTLDPGDGAVVGPNQVAIQSVERSTDINTPSKLLIPQRYGNPKESGLTAEVKEGQANEFTFELED